MTALAAYWSLDGPGQRPVAATERILRGQQIYGLDPDVRTDLGPVALGRRLFPTVPEDAHDRGPVTGGEGRWTMVADIRLDARPELCAELRLDRTDSMSLSDAALALRAVERWGEQAIERLIGDFALILWDAHDQTLTLARDFLGNRPLHFCRTSSFLAVASMPKGLHALPEIPRQPDEEFVADFIGMLPEHGRASYFKHVMRVEPGEILVFSAARQRQRHYWNFEFRPLRLSDHEYVEATQDAFDRAVGARLRGAEDSVAAHLSGGLDSAAVAATAAQQIGPGRKLVAYTAAPVEGFAGPARRNRFNDESRHAADVAAMFPNIEHVIVRAGRDSPFARLDRNYFLFERPILNLCNGVWADEILDRCRAKDINVLLTGDMGNMTTSYDGMESLAAWLRRGRILRVLREAILLRRNGMRMRGTAARAIGPLLPRRVWEFAWRLRGIDYEITTYTALTKERANILEKRAKSLGVTNSAQNWADPIGLRLSSLLRADIGNFAKGFIAGWGVDVRDPTSDRRLVELCLSVPANQYLHEGQTRSLARRAFADRLPASIIGETRKGYQGADWHLGLRDDWSTARAELDAIARLQSARSMMDVDRLRQLLDAKDVDWDSREAEMRYRLALLRGISAGHFLRRASGAN